MKYSRDLQPLDSVAAGIAGLLDITGPVELPAIGQQVNAGDLLFVVKPV